MPTTLIFGGSGKVALHITRLLTTSKPAHTVLNVTRSNAHDDPIHSAGGTPLVASIEDSSATDMAALLKQHHVDTIIFSAGAGGKGDASRTDKVDREGAIKTMDAASEAGVRRYVMVSAVDVRDRSLGAPSWYGEEHKQKSDKGWGAIGKYMEAKLAADKELRTGNERRGLRYTIVRPTSLTTDEGKGTIEAGKVDISKAISREDVARAVVEVLKNDATVGLAFDIAAGDTAVADAIKKAADEKVDTFEGYY